jgi:serpin B
MNTHLPKTAGYISHTMQIAVGILSLLMMLILTAGCSLLQSSGNPDITYIKADIDRAADPSVTHDDIAEEARRSSTFGISFYQELTRSAGSSSKNIIFSPYSIRTALAMTYAGARGNTEEEMENTLLYQLGQDKTHKALNVLDLYLTNPEGTLPEPANQKGHGKQSDSGIQITELRTANSIWGSQGTSFSSPFLDILARQYGAGLRLMDFRSQPEKSRQIINRWVEEQTADKITDLLPPLSITPDTRMVLTNAVYFKGAWAEPFSRPKSYQPFHLTDSETILVPVMQRTASSGYAKGDGWKAVDIAYKDGKFSMIIILPDDPSGNLSDLEKELSSEWYYTLQNRLKTEQISLTMPVFEFTYEIGASELLADMGMPTAFSSQADFSGMTTDAALAISEVQHKAFIRVDEKGTEAAAATGVIMVETSIPEPTVTITVNQPFLFFIRETETGTILFAGRVTDPG